MGENAQIWSDAERRAWSVPEKLTPCVWAATHRYLPPSVAAESGRYNPDRTPYVKGILDAVVEEHVQEIVFLKCVQVGWSTTLENILGYWIDQDPGPCLFVMPTEEAAGEVVQERIRPLVQTSEALRRHWSGEKGDDTKGGIKFDTMPLYMGWAGSPGSLARRACRYVVYDEIDKFPPFSGREADAISLGKERTSTYMHRRRVLLGSTPTTRDGPIWKAWESCGDKRRFHVPCPHCEEYQTLLFGQLHWPELKIDERAAKADAIQSRRLAWYECASCKEKITESHKQAMLARGVWLSDSQKIDADGVITGSRPKASRVGFWINALYSPWKSFSDVAAEAVRSSGDPAKKQNFRNSWLAEPFEEQVKTTNVADLRPLLVNAPRAGIVPKWAPALFASVDVQGKYFYWLLRAWGAGFKSQLVKYGMALTFDDVRKICLDTAYPIEGGDSVRPHLLVIDSGYRKDEVYQFCQSDERCRAIKGASQRQTTPIVASSTTNAVYGFMLNLIDTQFYKDRLATFRTGGCWLLNDEVDEEYLNELAAEHKIVVKGAPLWVPKSEGLANHRLDLEVYQFAAADMARVDLLGDGAEEEAPPATSSSSQYLNRGSGGSWLGNRGGSWLKK